MEVESRFVSEFVCSFRALQARASLLVSPLNPKSLSLERCTKIDCRWSLMTITNIFVIYLMLWNIFCMSEEQIIIISSKIIMIA